MADAEAGKRAATLDLVCRALSSEGLCSSSADLPMKFEDLRDGTALYRILACIAPSSFPNAAEMAEQTAASRANWVVRKGNLIALVRHLNDYAHEALGAPDTFNLSLILSPADIANSPALAGESTTPNPHDRGPQQLTELTDMFVVAAVLSGREGIMRAVKAMSHADQVALSNAAKTCLTRHALRPRRGQTTPTLDDARRSSAQRRSSGASTGTAESRKDRKGAPPSLLDETALGSQTVPQLRRELEDAKALHSEMESTLQLAQSEGREWESKYRQLLDETERRRVGFTDAEHLRELLAKRDETVRTLTAAIGESTRKMAAFREATAAQESVLGTMKRKLRHMEDELVRKAGERRDALERLAVAEDKLALQVRARADLEKELEEVRTSLVVAQLVRRDLPGEEHMSRSFGSVASVDRVAQLENELDEVRAQKDAAERLLRVLQRQVAALPAEVKERSSGAADALKAQLRQAEREKEELRNQLATTIARLEEAQVARVRRAGSQDVVESETEENAGETSERGAAAAQEADTMRQEMCAMASSMLLLGYRNLMLQQRSMLLRGASEAGQGVFHEMTQLGGNNGNGATAAPSTGSFLTQHRREVETGLLVSALLHRNDLH